MSCDILLINPPAQSTSRKAYPPLGILYLAAYLRQSGFRVAVRDLSADDSFRRSEVASFLAEENPTVIGFSSFTEAATSLQCLMGLAADECPKATIVVGGHFATFCSDFFLRNKLAHYVVLGEGELAFEAISRRVLNGEAVCGIPGVMSLSDANPCRGSQVCNLDSLPFPARDLVDLSKYQFPFTIATARGCPGRCIFCSSGAFWGKPRLRSAAGVFAEINYLVLRCNPKRINPAHSFQFR